MQQVEGIKFPSILVSILMKPRISSKRTDELRGTGKSHQFLQQIGFVIYPCLPMNIFCLTQSLHFGAENRMNTAHEPTNLKIGILMIFGSIHRLGCYTLLITRKTTKSPNKAITLDDKWKAAYKRQMDFMGS